MLERLKGCCMYLVHMALWALSIFLIGQCTSSTQRSMIKSAREGRSIESYSLYLEEHPRGRFANEAKQAVLYLAYTSDVQIVDELLEKSYTDGVFEANLKAIKEHKQGALLPDELLEQLQEQQKKFVIETLPRQETPFDVVIKVLGYIVTFIFGLILICVSTIPSVVVFIIYDNKDEIFEYIRRFPKILKEYKVGKKYANYPNAYKAITTNKTVIESLSNVLTQSTFLTEKYYKELISKSEPWLINFESDLIYEFQKNVEKPYKELQRLYPEGLKAWRKRVYGDQTYWRNILEHKEEIIELDRMVREEF